MAMPPTHICHSMLVYEALTAVHSSYSYGLLIRAIDYNLSALEILDLGKQLPTYERVLSYIGFTGP